MLLGGRLVKGRSRLHEAQRFYDRYPRWSRLGKMVRDVRSAVDLLTLAGLPEGAGRPEDKLKDMPPIDAGRIYLLGYSLGGTVALHAAALEFPDPAGGAPARVLDPLVSLPSLPAASPWVRIEE